LNDTNRIDDRLNLIAVQAAYISSNCRLCRFWFQTF